MLKNYRKMVDNHMKVMGETDTVKKTIKINKKASKAANKHKAKGNRDQVLDSEVHELYHAKHPHALEKTTWEKTPKIIKSMGKVAKSKVYGSFYH